MKRKDKKIKTLLKLSIEFSFLLANLQINGVFKDPRSTLKFRSLTLISLNNVL